MVYMFEGCNNLTTIIGLENLNTSKVTSMRFMFYNCDIEEKYKPKFKWNH